MSKYGYLENLMRPMKTIGQAPEDADRIEQGFVRRMESLR